MRLQQGREDLQEGADHDPACSVQAELRRLNQARSSTFAPSLSIEIKFKVLSLARSFVRSFSSSIYFLRPQCHTCVEKTHIFL